MHHDLQGMDDQDMCMQIAIYDKAWMRRAMFVNQQLQEQLPSRVGMHYDFGAASLMRILGILVLLKRAHPDEPDEMRLLNAALSTKAPALAPSDLPTFQDALNDVFAPVRGGFLGDDRRADTQAHASTSARQFREGDAAPIVYAATVQDGSRQAVSPARMRSPGLDSNAWDSTDKKVRNSGSSPSRRSPSPVRPSEPPRQSPGLRLGLGGIAQTPAKQIPGHVLVGGTTPARRSPERQTPGSSSVIATARTHVVDLGAGMSGPIRAGDAVLSGIQQHCAVFGAYTPISWLIKVAEFYENLNTHACVMLVGRPLTGKTSCINALARFVSMHSSMHGQGYVGPEDGVGDSTFQSKNVGKRTKLSSSLEVRGAIGEDSAPSDGGAFATVEQDDDGNRGSRNRHVELVTIYPKALSSKMLYGR
jgi:hypothetical protein